MTISKEEQSRIPELDVMKGILAILVVLGHMCIKYDDNYKNNIVFRFCYSFHMAGFMAISGYFVGKKYNVLNYKKTIKRILSYAIPYAVWIIVYLFFNKEQIMLKSIGKYIWQDKIWFLRALIIYNMCIAISKKILAGQEGKKLTLHLIIMGVIFEILFAGLTIFTEANLKMELIYWPFYIGMMILGCIYIKETKMLKIITNVSLILYPVSFLLYRYSTSERRLLLESYKINNSFTITMYTFFCIYLVALLGTFFIYKISVIISNYKSSYFLAMIGKYTLQIYLISELLKFPFVTKMIWVNVIAGTIIGILICLFFSMIIEKFDVLNFVFFGKSRSKK